jgi:predicted nucleotidyltransferase
LANAHFAKLGDIWKHLPLVEALDLEPAAAYCETHAGSAWYPLTPSPKRAHGIGIFLDRSERRPALAASRFDALLRGLPAQPNGCPQRYPGSATLAMLTLGRRADYLFADLDPASVRDLQTAAEELDLQAQTRCIAGDGLAAVLDFCEETAKHSDPRDVVVHIDPFLPHDASGPTGRSPVQIGRELGEQGFRVFYWYGFDDPDRRGWAWDALHDTKHAWAGEIDFPARLVYDGRPGVWGCGVVLLNFAPATCARLNRLGAELANLYRDIPMPDEPPFNFRQYTQGASAQLLALAAEIADIYKRETNPDAIIVAGSAARGDSDPYSDLDLMMYYRERLPDQQLLDELRDRLHASDLIPLGSTDDAILESFAVRGVECQVGHVTVERIERSMAEVLDDHDAASLSQKVLSGIQECVVLHGDELVAAWRERAANYPPGLAAAMIRRHLRFFPLWTLPYDWWTARDAAIFQHEMLVQAAQNLLGVLAGLNRVYFSTFQIKHVHALCETFEHKPHDLEARLQRLLARPDQAGETLEQLVAETIQLVDQHEPDIDTANAKRWLGRRRQPWDLSP